MDDWPERFKTLAMAWLEEQWNKPSRSDYYLMRIAQRIQAQWSKKPATLKDQIIEFEQKKAESKPMDPVARSKAIWLGGLKAAQKAKDK